jgi:hypothetical protein
MFVTEILCHLSYFSLKLTNKHENVSGPRLRNVMFVTEIHFFKRNCQLSHSSPKARTTPHPIVLGTSAMKMNKCLVAVGLFAATFVSSSASADWSSNYPWCLMTEGSQECAFTSMAQCLASRHGNVDFCEPNNTYIGHTRSYG